MYGSGMLMAVAMGGAPSGCGGRSPTGAEGLLQIAAVGDSITQGSHSTGGNATWPGQLQLMLEAGPRSRARRRIVRGPRHHSRLQKFALQL